MQENLMNACRVGVWLFSMISFSILASDEDDHNFHYTDWTALRFSVGIGVMTWLLTSFIFGEMMLSKFANMELLSPDKLENLVIYGDMLFAFFCYTAVICLSTFSTNLSDQHAEGSYADKLNASCCFMWFVCFCYGPLVYWGGARNRSETMPNNTGSYTPVDMPPGPSAYASSSYNDDSVKFGDAASAPSADV